MSARAILEAKGMDNFEHTSGRWFQGEPFDQGRQHARIFSDLR